MVLKVWRRRKWLAIVTFAAVFLPALTIVLSLPDIYRATATLLVDRQQVAEAFVKSAVTGEETETRLETIKQEMLSSAVLIWLVQHFNLNPGGPTSLGEAVVRTARDIKIDVKAVDQAWGRGATIAFAVSYRGRDPATVAQVANALATFYVDRNMKMRERRASETADFLKTQLGDVGQRLESQQRRVDEFKRRFASELPEQVPVNMATLERLNTELRINTDSQQKALDRRAALAKELAEPGSLDLQGGTDAGAARLAKLRQELRELRSRFTDNYPDVVQTKRAIADLEAALAEGGPVSDAERADPSVARVRDGLREPDRTLKALRAEEERLRGQVAVYQARIENAPRREQELQELSRGYAATKELYGSLLKRSEEAQLASRMEQQKGEQFRILDQAGPPTEPAAPNRMRLILVSVLLAIGAAGAAAMLAEHLDTSFHALDDLRSFTKVPVVASIPRIVRAADTARHVRQRRLATVSVALGLALVMAASYHLAHGNDELVRVLSRGGS
jgi:polysaccharide chain length determinant protein (PEP-CTERM system associated)